MATAYAVNLYEGVNLAESLRVKRGAVEFTNTSGQFRIPNGPTSVTAYTFTTWVKITNDTNFYALWLSLQGASTTYWETGFDITGTGAEINDLTTERSIGINFTVNKWYFFGVSHGTSGAVKVFIGDEGGTLTAYTTTLAPLVLPLADALLGGELSYEHLDGAMSETRFWNAVLSDAEFFTEYRSEIQARTSNAGGWWKLENTSSKFTDSSGASNTLTNPSGTGTWAFLEGPRIDGAPGALLVEAIGLAEVIDIVYTPAGGGSYTGDVNETVTVSEALAAILNTFGDAPETVSLSESTSVVVATVGTVSEDVGALGEALTELYAAVAGLPETVTLSESFAAVMATSSAVSEDVGAIGEAVGNQSAYTGDVDETVTLSESVSALYAAVHGLAETVTLSEALAAAAALLNAVSESVDVAETNAAVMATSSAVSEDIGAVSESVTGIRGIPVALDETVTLAESLASLRAAIAALSETVTLSDSVSVPNDDVIALLVALRERAWSAVLASSAFAAAVSSSGRYTCTIGDSNMIVTINTRARLEATFTTPTGTRYAPATLSLVVENPSGTETTYTSPTIVNDTSENTVGDYYCDVLFNAAGDWKYAWRSTASGEEVAAEGRVRVTAATV